MSFEKKTINGIIADNLKTHNSPLFKPMKAQKLVLISLLFLILFNFPMLSIFNNGDSINGIPTLYVYVFFVWILFIVLVFNIIRKENKENSGDE